MRAYFIIIIIIIISLTQSYVVLNIKTPNSNVENALGQCQDAPIKWC
jgi:uncharacterized protein YpmB